MNEQGRRVPFAGIIYLLFFLSGFAGLVYEVLWMRRFAVSFGNTTHAATVVLTAFMGGLALGSFVLGRLADRFGKSPAAQLRLYGWMEIGIGLYCLAFNSIHGMQQQALLEIYQRVDPGSGMILSIKFIFALAILIVPTTLMGGTLPVLIKHLSRTLPAVGRITGRLYSINSLGAVAGTLAVAFWMIPALGMELSNAIAAAVNVLVGMTALALRNRGRESADIDAVGELSPETQDTLNEVVIRGVLAAIFLSGISAMVYQVTWMRLLSMVLGSSTYSFSLMVASFITGISIGGYVISRSMKSIRRPARAFALIQLLIALSVALSLPLYSRLPLVFVVSRNLINFSYPAFEFFKYSVCFLIMCVPTTLFGMGFPLVSRMAARGLDTVAGKVGGVYALNTLGNILGSAAAGLLLVPLLGLKLSVELAIVVNLLSFNVILYALWREDKSLKPLIGKYGLISVGVLLLLIFIPDWDRTLLTSGVYRYRGGEDATVEKYLRSHEDRNVLFYEEGLTTTVSVEEGQGILSLRVNGKPDASTGLDMNTQLMLGHLPQLLHGGQKNRVLVIGVGSGVTGGAVLSYPDVSRVVCVEISPEVIEASKYFADYNNRYWQDKRSEIVIDDGRNFLFRTGEKFDIITSEPSNPWIAGIGNLYTEEFYSLCREKLADGGLICQWIHLYEMEDGVFKIILRTFSKYFPGALAFSTMEEQDLLLIGWKDGRPGKVNYDMIAERLKLESVAGSLGPVKLKNVFTLLSTQVASPAELSRWVDIGQFNTDNFPVVEYLAPRGFFYGDRVHIPYRYRFNVEAGSLMAEFLAGRSPTVDEIRPLADYYINARNDDIAMAAYEDILERDSSDMHALGQVARILIDRGQYEESLEFTERYRASGAPELEVLKLSYPSALDQAQRGYPSFVDKPDYSLPLAIKARLCILEPKSHKHPLDMADIYYRLGEYDQAASAYALTLERLADDPEKDDTEDWYLMLRTGQSFLEEKEYDRAAKWYAEAASRTPDRKLAESLSRTVTIRRLVDMGVDLSDTRAVRDALRN